MRSLTLALCSIGLVTTACGAVDPEQARPPFDETATGDVTAELEAVPASVLCIRITYAQTATTSKTFSVTTASSTALSLGKIPLGVTKFKGEAFNVACSSVSSSTSPDWITPYDVSMTVVPGVDTAVPLTLRPNVPNTVKVNFEAVPTKIVAGGGTTFAFMPDGTVRSWGGSLMSGDGGNHPVPATIPQLAGFTSISVGTGHACGIKAGNVYCWGNNDVGQFGVATPTSSPTPVQVWSGANAAQVAVGDRHTCLMLIPTASGEVLCAGDNTYGQIISPASSTPYKWFVQRLLYGTRIASGANTSYAVSQWCASRLCAWGDNTYGQLGDGTTTPRAGAAMVLTPPGMVDLQAGAQHACARGAEGRTYCWGRNDLGQLGDGTTSLKSTPTPFVPTNVTDQIAVGAYHTCYRVGKQAWCAGYNGSGQVGVMPAAYGSYTNTSPKKIVDGATDLAAGFEHTCAVFGSPAVAPDQTRVVQCWGAAYTVGDGAAENRYFPVNVVW